MGFASRADRPIVKADGATQNTNDAIGPLAIPETGTITLGDRDKSCTVQQSKVD